MVKKKKKSVQLSNEFLKPPTSNEEPPGDRGFQLGFRVPKIALRGGGGGADTDIEKGQIWAEKKKISLLLRRKGFSLTTFAQIEPFFIPSAGLPISPTALKTSCQTGHTSVHTMI
jgi:hypothetical protein